MASVSEIENIICNTINNYIYPENTSGVLLSTINENLKICRGWPQEVELSKDLMSSSGISWIAVNQQPGQTKNKTRYGRQWKTFDTNDLFGLSVDNVINSSCKVEFSGTALQNGLAGIVISEKAYPVVVQSGQDSATVTNNIYELIKSDYSALISIDGSTITSQSEIVVKGFCGGNSTMYQEISRLEDMFCTSVFSPSIVARDNVENAVIESLLTSDTLSNATFDRGIINFQDRKLYDNNLNANLYRVDIMWSIEFAIISTISCPPLLLPSIDVNSLDVIGII
ncbi:hypothetical protein AA0242T_1341 [Acetobacter aceti NRIC 0242]|uniref:Baseplate protein J-like domain-containing protein n=1 Tax=Acetobacter aceti NBRC 14818 TaxID=887700 RepID=A0AB33ICN3_ACEAC|nr:hypothetical protein [Acetobacter aceti]TCS33153.1 hypothetical protein EDC15_10835 [Acetobacter aceti NBRC 14818]BCK75787.1 hypothetical protein EMQ_1393 [Acetobacter aceti NBRC 14818]GAN57966.1 hypothetical protein Abac_022_099 [Acetobacter aceti NBRC 14818]GBO80639.1 hypothetical protein AA0242T_1341 [Acetobacter aceti NRIC 0242]